MAVDECVGTLSGTLELSVYSIDTRETYRYVYENLIVNNGRFMVANLLSGVDNSGVTYFAMGSGVTSPVITNTALETESFRKLIGSRTVESLYYAKFVTFLSSSEANGSFREAALVGGSTASVTAGSGVLFSRVPINLTKSSSQTLTATWRIGVGV